MGKEAGVRVQGTCVVVRVKRERGRDVSKGRWR